MSSSELLLIVLLLSLPFILLIAFLNWTWMKFLKSQNQSLSSLASTLMESQKEEKLEKKDLLNRMMSQDLPTYATTSALTTSSQTFSDLIPRDDVTEAERAVAFGGFGQTLYDEDAAGFQSDLEGLGLYVNPDR